MPRSSARVVFALLTCTLLIPSCHSTPKPTGECTGTYLGRSVTWPLTLNSYQPTLIDSDGSAHTQVQLNYTPNGVSGLVNWGARITLTGEPRFEASSSRTVKLQPQQERLVPEETSLVRGWEGFTSQGSAYPTPPGVPVEGSVTLRRVTPDHAEGQFVYRYEDGGMLTCTFDVPDRVHEEDEQDSGGGCGGGGGYDDDDDD
ncbi:hypothetical protein [Archangium violaceum]|uniref:hypothetical protein n=1 Tax=Archangium violaceum TaxID=83451 RepID=UPI001269FF04|nr:hypothetical protein [Archangium violaceum]